METRDRARARCVRLSLIYLSLSDHICTHAEDGKIQTLDLQDKWSTTILKELMDLAGGDPWKRHVEEATRAGMPVLPGSTVYEKTEQEARKDSTPLPSLKEYMKTRSS